LKFRRKLSIEHLQKCLNIYESEELALNMTERYYELKKQLLSHRKVTVRQMESFIDQTKTYPYTCFQSTSRKSRKGQSLEVKYDIKFQNYLYLQFSQFTQEIFYQVEKILKENSREYLILDLRRNGGGDLEICIKICNLFVQNCEIVTLQYRDREVKYFAKNDCFVFKKIYILVSDLTVSSSEILTLCLASNLDNVVLLGNKTFEKKVGQRNYQNLKYQYNFAVTVFYWKVNGLTISDIQDQIIPIENGNIETFLAFVYKDKKE